MAVLREAQTTEPKTDRRRRPRLIIPVQDGVPDCSSLSDEARASLRESLLESEPAPAASIDPAIISIAVRAIAGIEAAMLAGRFGVSTDQAREALMPNPLLESQIAAAGARVLEKHSTIMGRYGDEIVLASLIVAWQAQALTALRAARAERAETEQMQTQTQSVERKEPAGEKVYLRDPRDEFPES